MEEDRITVKKLLTGPLNQILLACIIILGILKQPLSFTSELLSMQFPRGIISAFVAILLTVVPWYLCIQKGFIENSKCELEELLNLLGKTKFAIIYLLNAFSEELLFRVALLGMLLLIMDAKSAILISAILFTLAHSRYRKSWKLMLLIIWVGIVLGNLYISTGSIVTIIVVHFTHNMLIVIPQIEKEEC